MIDPCWLPSAIMQTVGALYAVFIVIFILTLQHLEKHDMLDYEIKELSGFILWRSKKPPIIKHFMYLSFLVAFTISCNGYFIYLFTIHEPVTGESIKGVLALSLLSLLTVVGYAVFLSYALIETLIKKDKRTDS